MSQEVVEVELKRMRESVCCAPEAHCERACCAPEAHKKAKGFRRFLGILLTFTSGICFTVSSLMVKLLQHQHPINISFWGGFGYFLPILPVVTYFMLIRRVNVFSSLLTCDEDANGEILEGSIEKWKQTIILLFSRFCGVGTFISKLYALQYLTIADFTIIKYCGPIVAIVMAHFFLKERCGFITLPISFLALFGVAVIARPPFLTRKSTMDSNILVGVGFAMGVVLLSAVVFISTRRLRRVHFSVLSFSSGLTGLVTCGLLAYTTNVLAVPTETSDIVVFGILGFASFCGSVSFIAAMKFEEVATVKLIRMSDVALSFVFQFVFLSVVPDIWSIIGALIIMSGVLLIIVRRIVASTNRQHSCRRACKYLLL